MQLEIPPPLPDEIIYSTLARARFRMGWSTTRFAQQLFGGRTIIVRPHLCGQLDLVAATTALVAGWRHSAEHLRDNHTLFPLVGPFLDPRHHNKCAAALHGDRVSRHHVGVSRQLLGITPFTELLSCPRCRRIDRMNHGEAYLHRVHQVPGATVCDRHGCPLQRCGIYAEPEFYTALDEATQFRTLRVPLLGRALHYNIATDLRELLDSPPGAGTIAASFPNLFSLASRLAVTGTSPLMQVLTFAATSGEPLSLALAHSSGQQLPTASSSRPLNTDARWLQRVRHFLPDRVSELAGTYRRRIAFLTLKRAIEAHTHVRLPARAHVPRTTAFIETFVEDRATAEARLARLGVFSDDGNMRSAA